MSITMMLWLFDPILVHTKRSHNWIVWYRFMFICESTYCLYPLSFVSLFVYHPRLLEITRRLGNRAQIYTDHGDSSVSFPMLFTKYVDVILDVRNCTDTVFIGFDQESFHHL